MPSIDVDNPKRTGSRVRVLAVVSNFKWQHIDYLTELAKHFDLAIATSGEAHEGSIEYAATVGLRSTALGRIEAIGAAEISRRIAQVVRESKPAVVHLMYYHHEELAPIIRSIVGARVLLVFECRDPITTIRRVGRDSEISFLEREALYASDAQIFVSRALRTYYEQLHDLKFEATSIIVPHSFARRNAGPPSKKLSRRDDRTHIALVGTADPAPGGSRWYGDIIRRLVAIGFVVHSHFHEIEGESLDRYHALALELVDYHFHPTVSFRDGTKLSQIISQYDLMGVFYDLEPVRDNESATLRVCMPTKAVCGWFNGAIPAVCFPHYEGLRDWIEDFGIGFIADGWDDLAHLLHNRPAIDAAIDRCFAIRDRFSNEHNAEVIQKFIGNQLAKLQLEQDR
jgi:hypothetical protein